MTDLGRAYASVIHETTVFASLMAWGPMVALMAFTPRKPLPDALTGTLALGHVPLISQSSRQRGAGGRFAKKSA